MKTKTYRNQNHKSLDLQIEKFINETENIKVIDIKFSMTDDHVGAMILYVIGE